MFVNFVWVEKVKVSGSIYKNRNRNKLERIRRSKFVNLNYFFLHISWMSMYSWKFLTDRFTEKFIDSWTQDNEQGEKCATCVNLTKARQVCKLTYLNGAAPMVYGLPVKFKSFKASEI